jgi:hypothetical protein
MALYTYNLIDGRKVTFAGKTERHAFALAHEYHPYAVTQELGVPAERCTCKNARAYPQSVRRGGFLICAHCGGYFG